MNLHFLIIALTACGSILLSAASPNSTNPPNIIYILSDDQGYGDVGVFWQNQRAAQADRSRPLFATPQLDKMARAGVMMTQHYVGAPVCAPARASLLTGLTQGHANVRDNQFDQALADTHTLATVLREAGYATAAVGKWGLQGANPEDAESTSETWSAHPTKRGFDDYFGYVRHEDGHSHYPKENEIQLWENDAEISELFDRCYSTDLFTARAKKWIVDHSTSQPEQPFFLFLAYDTPHFKLQNPPCAYPAWGGIDGGVQWMGEPHAMINTATGSVDDWMHPDFEAATWDHDRDPDTAERPWPDSQKRYANSVRRIDDSVGDVLQLLRDLNLDDNTLVVFTSDNGPTDENYRQKARDVSFFQSYGPFDRTKRDVWEGGLRMPTIAYWPSVFPAGRVDHQPSGQWDWLATFSELAGLAVPPVTDGVSLTPNLTGQGEREPGVLYFEYFSRGKTPKYRDYLSSRRGRKRGQMQAIHHAGYKGVRYDVQSADDDFEIYDLLRDPGETQNLAAGDALAKVQAEMKARVLQVRLPDPAAPRP
mgnify:CR=1 FL=1